MWCCPASWQGLPAAAGQAVSTDGEGGEAPRFAAQHGTPVLAHSLQGARQGVQVSRMGSVAGGIRGRVVGRGRPRLAVRQACTPEYMHCQSTRLHTSPLIAASPQS